MKRDFIALENYTEEEISRLIELTDQLKKGKVHESGRLTGKAVGLLFQKPSNRTRVSFQVGVWQLGGNCLYLSPSEISLGVRESIHDVAKTLSRYLSCLVARTFTHHDVMELAKHATIPVINGLSDLHHPCQALTDLFSIKEKLGELKGLTLSYVGDGNNVCHSLLVGASQAGLHMKVATPKGYEPHPTIVTLAKSIAKKTGSKIVLTNSPQNAVKDANVIYSDTWVSMGQEEETKKRLKDFEGFQMNSELVKLAKKDYIFMHCLPAHRGQEVTADVIDGKHSIIFDQAENRLHTQKAILIYLLDQIKNVSG